MIIFNSLKYKSCKTCDGFGWVTMIGKIPHSVYPNQEYEFGAPCQCENGKARSCVFNLPDYIQLGIMGYERKYIF